MEKQHEHHRESDLELAALIRQLSARVPGALDCDDTGGLTRIGKQIVGIVVSLAALGTALYFVNDTRYVKKTDADLTTKELQCQLSGQNNAIAQVDKTTAVTAQKVENIEKMVFEIKRMVK